jgi:hypothetical protein
MSADIILFVPRPNPNRESLIQQARANYEAIFPTEIANVALIGSPPDTAMYESSLGFVAPEDCA